MAKNFVKSFNLLGMDVQQIPCITGTGNPSNTNVEGAVGSLYMDTTTGNIYKCTAASDSIYTWEPVGSDLSDIDATFFELLYK